MHRTAQNLTADELATARLITLNPTAFHDDPVSRIEAWAALKQARGQSVNPRRLGLLQNLYVQPPRIVQIPVQTATPYIPDAPFIHIDPDFDTDADGALHSYAHINGSNRLPALTYRAEAQATINAMSTALGIALGLAIAVWLAAMGVQAAAFAAANPDLGQLATEIGGQT